MFIHLKPTSSMLVMMYLYLPQVMAVIVIIMKIMCIYLENY